MKTWTPVTNDKKIIKWWVGRLSFERVWLCLIRYSTQTNSFWFCSMWRNADDLFDKKGFGHLSWRNYVSSRKAAKAMEKAVAQKKQSGYVAVDDYRFGETIKMTLVKKWLYETYSFYGQYGRYREQESYDEEQGDEFVVRCLNTWHVQDFFDVNGEYLAREEGDSGIIMVENRFGFFCPCRMSQFELVEGSNADSFKQRALSAT